jgi:hypothetical protein
VSCHHVRIGRPLNNNNSTLTATTVLLDRLCPQAAVGQIKSEHLNEIRSLKMPPEPIADVLGAVLKLLGIHDVSWLSMKKFLGNRGVKDEILTFDAHRISGEMRKDVAKLLKNKASSFDHATITRVSVAAAPLAAWVKANIRYSVVLEKIGPLEGENPRGGIRPAVVVSGYVLVVKTPDPDATHTAIP